MIGSYGDYRWNARTQELQARLGAARVPVYPRTVDTCELQCLPAPVQRYFRVVLKGGGRWWLACVCNIEAPST